MDGEGEATGYEILGHLFALGYQKGLLDAYQPGVSATGLI
jgi:hypothetical protein